MPFRILIADDDPDLCDLFRNAVLRLEPSWTAEVARDGRKALDMLCERHFDVAVLDFAMPHLNGLEVLEAVRQKAIQTDVVIMTGYGDVDLAVQAMKMGAREFLEKPFTPLDLITAIRKVLEDHHPSLDAVAERLDAFLKNHAG